MTSSSTGLAGVFSGLGLSPFKINEVIGVVKGELARVLENVEDHDIANQALSSLHNESRKVGIHYHSHTNLPALLTQDSVALSLPSTRMPSAKSSRKKVARYFPFRLSNPSSLTYPNRSSALRLAAPVAAVPSTSPCSAIPPP